VGEKVIIGDKNGSPWGSQQQGVTQHAGDMKYGPSGVTPQAGTSIYWAAYRFGSQQKRLPPLSPGGFDLCFRARMNPVAQAPQIPNPLPTIGLITVLRGTCKVETDTSASTVCLTGQPLPSATCSFQNVPQLPIVVMLLDIKKNGKFRLKQTGSSYPTSYYGPAGPKGVVPSAGSSLDFWPGYSNRKAVPAYAGFKICFFATMASTPR